MDTLTRDEYNTYYGGKNLWVFASDPALQRPGSAATGPMLCPQSVILRSEFYNDFLAPRRWDRVINLSVGDSSSVIIGLTILRNKALPEFAKEDIEFLERLAPHVQRAFDVNKRLFTATSQRAALEDAVDLLPFGVVLVDESGSVSSINAAARSVIDQHDGLAVDGDGLLVAATPAATKRLRELVKNASAAASCSPESIDAKVTCGDAWTIALPRPSGARPLEVLVAPVRRLEPARSRAVGYVAVFVSDPEVRAETVPEILQRLYGLTRAEARVVAELAEGRSVQDIADEMEIRPNTVRIHLKRVYSKTGVSRQSELVSLVLHGVGGLRLPP